jgi:hypothetical protein
MKDGLLVRSGACVELPGTSFVDEVSIPTEVTISLCSVRSESFAEFLDSSRAACSSNSLLFL